MRWLVTAVIRAVYLLPSLVLRLANVRIVHISPIDRVGHLAFDVDCFLKEGRLGLRPRFLALVTGDPLLPVANASLARYWRKHVAVASSKRARALFFPLTRFPWLRYEIGDYHAAMGVTVKGAAIQARWAGRPPLLSLTPEDRTGGRAALERLGIPTGAWFVCLHAREGGYAPSDERVHSHRNCDIERYLPAAEEIVARGGWCVRLGDASMKRLPRMKGLVDYAHSELKSDWLDVYLCASARFFLGNTSGLHFVSCVFGVPCAEANLVPLSAAFPLTPAGVGIPKLIWSEKLGRLLTFDEVFASQAADFRSDAEYDRAGLRPLENSADQIRDLAVEMLNRCEGKARYSPEDEKLQAEFRRLLRPGHYSFGAGSRIGRDFLRKHSDLLPSGRITETHA